MLHWWTSWSADHCAQQTQMCFGGLQRVVRGATHPCCAPCAGFSSPRAPCRPTVLFLSGPSGSPAALGHFQGACRPDNLLTRGHLESSAPHEQQMAPSRRPPPSVKHKQPNHLQSALPTPRALVKTTQLNPISLPSNSTRKANARSTLCVGLHVHANAAIRGCPHWEPKVTATCRATSPSRSARPHALRCAPASGSAWRHSRY